MHRGCTISPLKFNFKLTAAVPLVHSSLFTICTATYNLKLMFIQHEVMHSTFFYSLKFSQIFLLSTVSENFYNNFLPLL